MLPFLSVLLLCGLTVSAESPVTSYSITGDNNRYDYSNSVTSTSYLGNDVHNDNRDYYTAASGTHNLLAGQQGSTGDSLSATSYSGFSPSSHTSTFASYTGGSSRDSLSSQYPPSNHNTAAFRGYSSGSSSSSGDSAFDGYSSSLSHTDTDLGQYTSSSHKSPTYAAFTDSITGSSAYQEAVADASTFKGYATPAKTTFSFTDSDHGLMSDSPYSAFAAGTEFPFGKKELIFGGGSSASKYVADAYPSPSETRYVRGHQGSVYHSSPSMYLSTSGSTGLFSGVRGTGSSSASSASPSSAALYIPGKHSKPGNKYYGGEYTSHSAVNYLPNNQEAEYPTYSKGAGKVIVLKESRPGVYSGSSLPGSYISKVMGSPGAAGAYKSKVGSAISSYPGHGHSSMSGLHSSYSGSLHGGGHYSDGHLPRGYRSSAAYLPGHTSIYPTYS